MQKIQRLNLQLKCYRNQNYIVLKLHGLTSILKYHKGNGDW